MLGEPSATAFEQLLAARREGDLQLVLDQIYALADSPWAAPTYRFDIVAADRRVGTVSLRIGLGERLVKYAGQVGFGVEAEFRGNRFAGRAVRMLLPLAHAHGLQPLWLGCNPDNSASQRVMRWLGATYVETVDLPEDYHRYVQRGERQKERYRLDYALNKELNY